MMNYLKVSIGIFLALATTRFVPHPPNFTSLIALSFYVPVFLGPRYILALVLSFFITDLIIGFHSLTIFTWGSVFLIGLLSRYFIKNIYFRIMGVLSGILLFFLITNFGVWILGSYGYSLQGLITCYINAIPFLGNTFISTIIFATLIEVIFKSAFLKNFKQIKT